MTNKYQETKQTETMQCNAMQTSKQANAMQCNALLCLCCFVCCVYYYYYSFDKLIKTGRENFNNRPPLITGPRPTMCSSTAATQN